MLGVDLSEQDMPPPPPPSLLWLHLLLSLGTSVDNFSPRSRVLPQQSLWPAAKAVEGIEVAGEVGAEGGRVLGGQPGIERKRGERQGGEGWRERERV